MLKFNWTEVLKEAEKLGISYEINSENPGVFISKEDGKREKVSVSEILGVSDIQEKVIDKAIEKALHNAIQQQVSEIKLDSKHSVTFKIDTSFTRGVA